MSKSILLLIAVVVLVSIGVYSYRNKNTNPLAPATPQATNLLNCTEDDLDGLAEFQGAAGSIYASLTITNKTDNSCIMTLGNSIKINYSANNILTKYTSNSASQTYTLPAGGKVYSQIRYPNGPQCQGPTSPKAITITYGEGDEDTILDFADKDGKTNFTVQACAGAEKTAIDIWPLSKDMITK